MRTFTNLFKIKNYSEIEVILIGMTKLILTKIPCIKTLTALLTYAKHMNYIVLIVDQLSDIYMYDEEIFNLSNGFIIFFK